jgi:hypothetical protein
MAADTKQAAKDRLVELRENWQPEFVDGYVIQGREPNHPSHLTRPWYTVVRLAT